MVSHKSNKKRSHKKIANAFEIAERQVNGGNDSGSESDVEDGVLNASKFMNKGSDEFVDEEIDSDEALGSDDDYDVLNSRFSQTIRDKTKQRKTEPDLGESSSEEEYDSINEDELVGLSEVWDMDDDDLRKFKSQDKGGKVVLDDNWESEESSEESESESESESDNESDIFAHDNEEITLSNTLSQLKSTKPKERKRLVTQSIEENEFNVPSTKLSRDDMLAAVEGSISRKAILLDDAKPLDVPLPKNIQKKHERKAAYEITKEEVSKWQDIVQQNRQAEVLKFPMNAPSKPQDSALSFNNDHVATDEMGKEINKILETSGLADDKKEARFEDLAMAKLSPEEMKQRTNELRLMRELMFRDEARARRIKKIKSKTFRKIKKKERMKEEKLVEDDEDSDREDHDRKRAEERMNLKHKTNSKWAQSMIKSGLTKDATNRQEMEEMLRQGERLRTKQLGYDEGDQSDDNVSDIEREYQQNEDDEEAKKQLGKGVLAMDFMKKAEQRQREENLVELAMLKDLENGKDLEFTEANSVSIQKNQGRRVYTPAVSAMKQSVDEMNASVLKDIDEDESQNLVNRLSKPSKEKTQKESTATPSKQQENNEDGSNPWISTKVVQKSTKTKSVNSKSHKKKDETFIDMNENLDLEIESDDNTFQQQDLVEEAFVGDNVVAEFKKEKRKVAKDEDDKQEDLTMPGWGDWTGSKHAKKRKVVRTINGVVQKEKRRDKNLKNVIINEKVNKKNLKYQSSEVPFGYESREQYERSLRVPIGQEWTSRETHQRLTMPRVITKQGTVIDPLKATFK